MEFITIQKYIRTSPRKLKLVADMVKDMPPAKAVERLPFIGKRAAEPLSKAVKTALANAKQKGVNDTELVFKEIQINQGPKMKRWRAASRGRAKPYVRIMSHIRVVLETKETGKIAETKKLKVKAGAEKTKVKNQKSKTKTENVKKSKTEGKK